MGKYEIGNAPYQDILNKWYVTNPLTLLITDDVYDKALRNFAQILKENADVYTGECSCRKAISIDKVFELLEQNLIKGKQQ